MDDFILAIETTTPTSVTVEMRSNTFGQPGMAVMSVEVSIDANGNFCLGVERLENDRTVLIGVA